MIDSRLKQAGRRLVRTPDYCATLMKIFYACESMK
jgi:hypothetical protein